MGGGGGCVCFCCWMMMLVLCSYVRYIMFIQTQLCVKMLAFGPRKGYFHSWRNFIDFVICLLYIGYIICAILYLAGYGIVSCYVYVCIYSSSYVLIISIDHTGLFLHVVHLEISSHVGLSLFIPSICSRSLHMFTGGYIRI